MGEGQRNRAARLIDPASEQRPSRRVTSAARRR